MAKTKTSFKKGHAGPGRPLGSPNKITASVKESFYACFTELQGDPKVNLIAWAKKNPSLFYQLATKLIPTEIKGNLTGKVQLEIIRKTQKQDENI